MNFTASAIEGSFVLAASYAGCDPMVVGLFLTTAVGAQGMQTSGEYINAVDLSPNYSGTLFGLFNTLTCVFGVLVPVFIGLLTPNVSPRLFCYYYFFIFIFPPFLHSSRWHPSGASFLPLHFLPMPLKYLCLRCGDRPKRSLGILQRRLACNYRSMPKRMLIKVARLR